MKSNNFVFFQHYFDSEYEPYNDINEFEKVYRCSEALYYYIGLVHVLNDYYYCFNVIRCGSVFGQLFIKQC